MITPVHNHVASLTWRVICLARISRRWLAGLLVLRVILLRERGHGGRKTRRGLGVHWSSSCLYRPAAQRGLEPHPISVWRVITSGVSSVPRGDKTVLPPPLPSPAPPSPMPFVRYLLHDGREVSEDDNHQFDPNFPSHLPQVNENGGQSSSSDVPGDSSPLQFQLPYFIAFGSPTVAPGGGAEVLPYSQLQPTGDPSPNWLSQPFSPFSPTDP